MSKNLGYSGREILNVDFADVAREVAKFDYTSSVLDYFRRGEMCGVFTNSLYHGDKDPSTERRWLYDRALIESMSKICDASNPVRSFYHYARFVIGKKPSGIDWVEWRAPEGADIPKIQERYNTLSTDIELDAARRMGWIDESSVMPVAMAAALHYRRDNKHSSIDRGLHKIERDGTNIKTAIGNILGQIKPRRETFYYVSYFDDIGQPEEKPKPEQWEDNILEYLPWAAPSAEYLSRESEATQEAYRRNAQVLKKLGYVGMSGIEMFVAELKKDYDRIDSVKI